MNAIEVDQKTEEEIMNAAQELRRSCGISEGERHFDICSMLDELRGVYPESFDYEVIPDKNMPDRVEAYYQHGVLYFRESIFDAAAWRPPQKIWDYVAAKKSLSYAQRARFTIAHELGHFALHSDNKYFRRKRRLPRDESRCSEEQANFFAAHLLISLPALEEVYKNGWLDTEYVSKKFRVSSSCAKATIAHYSKSLID